MPVLKEAYKNNYIENSAQIFFLGGEPAVLKEFNDIFKLLLKKNPSIIGVDSSGIEFIKILAKALKTKKVIIMISIDSGTRETYHKIKRTDSYELVIKNLKRYLAAAPYACDFIILKYIIIDKINDNFEEIEKWLLTASSMGIKKVALSMEFNHSTKFKKGQSIPKHYYDLVDYTENRSIELGLNFYVQGNAKQLLNQGYY